jgi:hypothetical protein
MLRRFFFSAVLLAGLVPTCAVAVIIDHDDLASVPNLSLAAMDLVGQQRWLFTHASVGGNMLDGMRSLRTANAARYKFSVSNVGFNSSLNRANDPPATIPAGTIYECNRGNPGWSAKVTIFANSVDYAAGWHAPKVDVVLDKLCYIDQTANATTYLNTMSALESEYPTTRFVYATMPLMTSEDNDNILRNQYNNAVRAYCNANNRLLFDIADMEAHDPNGVASTFTSGGQTYQKLYSGYTSDGGHLNGTGAQRIATGWYATAAEIAGVLRQMRWTRSGPGSWTEAQWDGNPPSCPDAAKDAIVDRTATVTVNSAQAARSLTLGNGGEVAIAAGGALAVGGDVALHAGTSVGRLTVASGASLTAARILLSGGTLAATGALGPPISLDAEGGKVEVGAGDLALSGTVSGAGVLTKIGAGTLTLSGENTSVGTVVQNGRLVAARANALPNGGLLTIGSGASVVLQSGLNADVREARVSVAVAPVPEPGTVVLLLAAVALLAWGWCLSGRGQVET